MAQAQEDTEMKCKCGLPAHEFVVKKEDSTFFGKTIQVCGRPRDDPGACKMFLEKGREATTAGFAPQSCPWSTCGRVMDQRKAKEGRNAGRGYHSCPIHNTFKWN